MGGVYFSACRVLQVHQLYVISGLHRWRLGGTALDGCVHGA